MKDKIAALKKKSKGLTEGAVPGMPSKKKNKFDDWEVENFARTLTDAEEIKSNPHKLKAAHAHLKGKHKALKTSISSISELRKTAKDRIEPESADVEDTDSEDNDD